MRTPLPLLLITALWACDDGAATSPVGDATPADATPADAAPVDGAAGDGGPLDAAPDATVDASVDAALPPNQVPRPRPGAAAAVPAPAGYRWAHGLIHMHSVHSHDACDGDPKPDGTPNAECLRRFRAAQCHNRFDFLLLTDHPDSFGDIPFAEAFLHAAGDVWDPSAEAPLANRIVCDDGHEVLLTVGSEGDLMPVMFREKPERALLRDASPEGVAGLHAAGALVFQAHIERFTAAQLAPLGLDGIEIYNLHANLDPRGELRQLAEILPDLTAWISSGDDGPHADLAYLAVWRENPLALAAWDGLLAQGPMLGFAGSDIHENVPFRLAPDGDRIDSYRRLGGWFSNWLLLPEGPVTWAAVREALEARRLAVVFDLLGPPAGFEVWAAGPDGAAALGAEAAFAAGWTLHARLPTPPAGAEVEGILWRVDAEGQRHEVTRFTEPLAWPVAEAGVYRVEVRQTPHQLAAELGGDWARFVRPLTWIYANPIALR
ncbi:MAG: hypothetical protein H6702_25470 [Myxococcales bacterium]|nr:hypothetical protein [Myxococcales bacterium]